jgi:hypothetical protein
LGTILLFINAGLIGGIFVFAVLFAISTDVNLSDKFSIQLFKRKYIVKVPNILNINIFLIGFILFGIQLNTIAERNAITIYIKVI